MNKIKFRFLCPKDKKMYKVLNICFEGAKTVTVQYNPVIKKRLDSGYLMQYTGLKDKNGNEIYEGDICSMSKKIDMKIIVDYKDAGFGWSDKYNNLAFRGHGYLTKILKDIEVIGNKFENPELLEEQCDK